MDFDSSNFEAPQRQPLPVLPNSTAAPAMNQDPPAEPSTAPPADCGASMHKSPVQLRPAQRSIEAMAVEALRSIFDPEIPVNIYDLGLIYEIDVDAQNHVKVKMTLTAPGCPVAGSLPLEVERKVESIPQVTSADVELVWDPPWDKSRMSEAALLDLGLL